MIHEVIIKYILLCLKQYVQRLFIAISLHCTDIILRQKTAGSISPGKRSEGVQQGKVLGPVLLRLGTIGFGSAGNKGYYSERRNV